MELTKKQLTIKYVCYCVMIIVADLLQNVSGLFPEIAGARCFILIPLAVFLASGEDFLAGSLLGFFAGLLWDLTSPVHMGFNCIMIALFCFITSVLITYIARNIFVTNLIASTLSTVIYVIFYWLFFIIIKSIDGGYDTLFYFYIPSAVYTAVVSLLIWAVLKPIKKHLNKSEV